MRFLVGVGCYFGMAIFTAALLSDPPEDVAGAALNGLFGIWWPITLPIIVIGRLGEWLDNTIKERS